MERQELPVQSTNIFFIAPNLAERYKCGSIIFASTDMKHICYRYIMFLCVVVLLSGCALSNFSPFDYKTGEDACVGTPFENWKLKLRGKKLLFQKKLIPKEIKNQPRHKEED